MKRQGGRRLGRNTIGIEFRMERHGQIVEPDAYLISNQV